MNPKEREMIDEILRPTVFPGGMTLDQVKAHRTKVREEQMETLAQTVFFGWLYASIITAGLFFVLETSFEVPSPGLAAYLRLHPLRGGAITLLVATLANGFMALVGGGWLASSITEK